MMKTIPMCLLLFMLSCSSAKVTTRACDSAHEINSNVPDYLYIEFIGVEGCVVSGKSVIRLIHENGRTEFFSQYNDENIRTEISNDLFKEFWDSFSSLNLNKLKDKTESISGIEGGFEGTIKINIDNKFKRKISYFYSGSRIEGEPVIVSDLVYDLVRFFLTKELIRER